MCLTRDGDQLRRIVQIDTLALIKAIDGITDGLVLPTTTLRSCPEEHLLTVHVDGLHLTRLLGSLAVDVLHRGLQRGIAPVQIAQLGTIVADVVDGSLRIPQHRTLHVGQFGMQHHLTGQLVELSRALHVLANHQRGVLAVTVPPVYQLVVVSGLVAYLPINLGNTVVYPALVYPQHHVGIQLVVVLQTVGIAAVGVALLVAIDAKGRHAELHPRLRVANGLIELSDKLVDIVAAPVVAVGKAIGVGLEVGSIGDGDTSDGIGIEIVVDMQSVDIVALQNVAHHIADIVAVLLQRRVEQRQPVVLEATLGMALYHVVGSIGVGHLRLGTIGIDPRVQFHAALVALGNHPSQGVPVGLGSLSLLTGQIVAPRL